MRPTFWRLYGALAALVIAGFAAVAVGPMAEERLFPIRTSDVITDIERTVEDWLCWRWSSDKLRMAEFQIYDAFLDRANGDRSYPEVFNRTTRVPWHKGGALPTGHSDVSFCIQIPPDARPTERLVLRQVLHYRGFMGVWDVPIALPDVVSEGVPP